MVGTSVAEQSPAVGGQMPVPEFASQEPLSADLRRQLWTDQLKCSLREHLKFDNALVRKTLGLGAYTAGRLCLLAGRRREAFKLLAGVHNSDLFRGLDASIAGTVRRSLERRTWATEVIQQYLDELQPVPATEIFAKEPERLIGSRAVVVKSARDNERGVLMVDYNFVFPFLAKYFDLNEIARKYYLLLLPSWTGLMDLDVLSCSSIDHPVFCLAYEQKDRDFLNNIGSNLHAVHGTTNFFCDHQTFSPVPGVKKDIDVLTVSAWGTYKRYPYLLRGLARLREMRGSLKAAFVGYPGDRQKADIMNFTRYFGLADCVEFHERITPQQVNLLFNRSRCNILWSRREGSGRTPVEGMLAGVPCVLRRGFNYGQEYEYMNEQTGRFTTEADLAETLNEIIETSDTFRPREWILDNMRPEIAMQNATAVMKPVALQLGEQWTEDPVATCNFVDSQEYLNPADRGRFDADHAFIKTLRRR